MKNNSKVRTFLGLNLRITEYYTLWILFLYTFLLFFFNNRIEDFISEIFQNIFIIVFQLLIVYISQKFSKILFLSILRRLYIIPLIFIIYSQTQLFIPIINPYEFDLTLIKWDYFIFGVNPTQWIYQISHPILTEYFQFAYMTFFFLPILHAFELALTGREKEFNYFTGAIVFGFFLSYLFYFAMPAIGPRFYLHDFANIPIELPGIFLTEFFRDVINYGGGVTIADANPMEIVNRDCMPSGHTMMTLLNIYLVFKNRSRFKYLILVFGLSLIIATIYLRYHYVVDLIAGIMCVPISLYLHKLIWSKFYIKNRDLNIA